VETLRGLVRRPSGEVTPVHLPPVQCAGLDLCPSTTNRRSLEPSGVCTEDQKGSEAQADIWTDTRPATRARSHLRNLVATGSASKTRRNRSACHQALAPGRLVQLDFEVPRRHNREGASGDVHNFYSAGMTPSPKPALNQRESTYALRTDCDLAKFEGKLFCHS
jgi:hypothetical protein